MLESIFESIHKAQTLDNTTTCRLRESTEHGLCTAGNLIVYTLHKFQLASVFLNDMNVCNPTDSSPSYGLDAQPFNFYIHGMRLFPQ